MGKISKSNFCSEVKRIIDQVSTNHQQIVTATSTANEAKTAAQNATTIASEAKVEAQNATTTSSAANRVANEANTTALSATTTANEANRISNEANTTATEANRVANEAKVSADTASASASAANTTAGEAKLAAENATTIANEAAALANEAKQLGNSVKQNMVSSLLSVDSSLPITTSSTWDEIIDQTGNIHTGIDINGVVEQYKVEAGEDISAGDFVEFINTIGTMRPSSPTVFESAGTTYISAVALNENKVVVNYRDTGNSHYGTAIVLSINDTSIIKGEPIVFESAKTDHISAVKLNENKILVSYRDVANNNCSTAIILSINDMDITTGNPLVFNNSNGTEISAVKLNENRVVVSYRDNGNNTYGEAIVLAINDMVITKGSPIVFNNAGSSYMSNVALNENIVLVCYNDNGNGYYGTAVVLTIDDMSITKGSPIVFESARIDYISAVKLNENKVLVSYSNTGNNSFGTAIVLTIDDTSIAKGSPFVFNNTQSYYISATTLRANKVLVGYKDTGNRSNGTVVVLTIKGMSIAKEPPIVFENASSSYISAVALTESKVLVGYRDDANSGHGTATIVSTRIESAVIKSTSRHTIHGVAEETGVAGQVIPVFTIA